MSTDQQPVSYDPRYDGIYQRGGAGATQRPEVQTTRNVPQQEPTRFPQQADTNERPAEDRPPAVLTAGVPSGPGSYSSSSEHRPAGHGTGPQDPSAIREVGALPEAPDVPARARNPFDVWVWIVAATLTAIGVYLTMAPIVFERAMMEAQTTVGSGSMFMNPWWNYTMSVAPTLILLGVGTALVQLFVLSIRHTLRAR